MQKPVTVRRCKCCIARLEFCLNKLFFLVSIASAKNMLLDIISRTSEFVQGTTYSSLCDYYQSKKCWNDYYIKFLRNRVLIKADRLILLK